MTQSEILTVIISAVSAVATFSAVIVALYQTKVQYMKKLKILYCDIRETVFIAHNSNQIICKHFSIGITNIGNKAITITNWGFWADKLLLFISIPETDKIKEEMRPKFPIKLETEESTHFNTDYDFFIFELKDLVNKGKINTKQKILFNIIDSSSKVYKVKSRQTVGQLIANKTPNMQI